jgi:hypothetical protein
MAQSEKPMGVVLIVCDRVIIDAKTHEKTLVATFNRIVARRFPCVRARMSIFVAVTNGKGTMNAQVRCVNESTNDAIFEAQGPLTFKDPNHVVEMNSQLNNVPFPKPGLHCIEFLCDDELVLHRRFDVVQFEEKGKQ